MHLRFREVKNRGELREDRVTTGGGVASKDADVKPPWTDSRRPPPDATRSGSAEEPRSARMPRQNP